MTEYEEPAAKMSKLEIPSKDHEEDMEDGQEEWLSEGILTDDDFNPATDPDKSDLNVSASHGDTTPSIPDDDNSRIQDTHAEDIPRARNNSVTPDNLDDLLNSHNEDNIIHEEDNIHLDSSHAEDVSHPQDESHERDNSNANSNAQVNGEAQAHALVQDETDAQDNCNVLDSSYVQEQTIMKKTDRVLDENIEQTLDNFENSHDTDIPEELGAFLVKKTNKKTVEVKKAVSDMDASTKLSDDDGNDTDELLRMLGEDGQKNKKEVKKVNRTEQKRGRESHSSDDDDYIFEGSKMARLKVAKNVILKKFPTKAVPEAMSDREDDSDGSSDEGITMEKMFVNRKVGNFAAKSTTKPPTRDAVVKKQVVTVYKPAPKKRMTASSPIQKSKPEVAFPKIRGNPPNYKKEAAKKVPEPHKPNLLSKRTVIVKEAPKPMVEHDEIIDEEEFLEEEDEFDLDEDFQSDPEPEKGSRQRIMRPEQMDEEVPTDGDSQSEDEEDSFYDEFPSSDSDQEEWFTLDVRAERAGDYIPLLGSKAHQLLTTEKKRVAARLQTIRRDLSDVNESSQQQADMLRRATMQLAELDAALKA